VSRQKRTIIIVIMILHLHFLQRASLVLYVLASLFCDNYIVATTAQELSSAFPSDQPSLGPSAVAAANTTSDNSPSLLPSLQLSTNPSSSPTDSSVVNPDIIGGVDADYGEYPFYAWPNNGLFLCGGTLIHEDIVLTAAHCNCTAFDPNFGIVVKIGGIDRSGIGAIDSIRAFACYPHPQFNNITLNNDIMLIVLETSSKAPTVTLNTDKTIPKTDELVTVIGYGLSISGDPKSFQDFLKAVTVKVEPDETCDVVYQNFVPEEEICTFGDGIYAACNGDSGGPLLTANNVQIGIVSYSRGDCESLPTVYTEVAEYAEWIQLGICSKYSSASMVCPLLFSF
jgi:secreted trypsin-like serine protease